MAFRRKENLSPEQVRERANQVMDAWQSYPDFAHLFAALMGANNLTSNAFARQYKQATGTSLSAPNVNAIRQSIIQPNYDFVAAIADHPLLSLDPERMRPGGDHRIAFFTAAGLIEVTPDAVKHWNQEVLAGWQRQRHLYPTRPQVNWKDLMNKLLSLHCQGGRWFQRDISAAASVQSDSTCQLDEQRTQAILSGHSAVPTRAERLALEKAAGLDSAQINSIETAVEEGILPLNPQPHPSLFSAHFSDVVSRLRAAGISQAQLVLRSVPPGQAEPDLSESCLSAWKVGRTRPTQAALRALVTALERCRDRSQRPLVAVEEIRQLVLATGFSLEELAATTHDIIARIDGTTRLKPLLSAIRNAADLSVPMSAVDSDTAQTDAGRSTRMAPLLQQSALSVKT